MQGVLCSRGQGDIAQASTQPTCAIANTATDMYPVPCILVLTQVVGRDVLFRGLRVRMSVATGGIDAVRLHSVTQRAEYVGEVLRKVQAVGETPQGGQVSRGAGREPREGGWA